MLRALRDKDRFTRFGQELQKCKWGNRGFGANPCRSAASRSEAMTMRAAAPYWMVVWQRVADCFMGDVGPEGGKGGMGDPARVTELTPLTGRDKRRAGCGVIPVYRNLSLVDGLLCGSWASCCRRERPPTGCSLRALCLRGSFHGHGAGAAMEWGKWNMAVGGGHGAVPATEWGKWNINTEMTTAERSAK